MVKCTKTQRAFGGPARVVLRFDLTQFVNNQVAPVLLSSLYQMI